METSNQGYLVAVIGGGVGGLVAANWLRRDGHQVIVIEKAQTYDGDGANGLTLESNALRCLFALGLERGLRDIADEGCERTVIKYSDGSVAEKTAKSRHFGVHRTDLLNLLQQKAHQCGVRFMLGTALKQIKERSGGRVELTLCSGAVINCDIVVGSDGKFRAPKSADECSLRHLGINSCVRRYLHPSEDYVPRLTGDCTFLFNTPRSVMEKCATASDLYELGRKPYQIWLGPQRTIVGWTMTNRNIYHCQMNDHLYGSGEAYGGSLSESDNDEKFVSRYDNMTDFRHRWADFCETVRHISNEAESCTRWRIAELPELPNWSSLSGQIVLLGDAAHAMPPFAGQGAALAIEDATILAKLISMSPSLQSLPKAIRIYEQMRQPRVRLVREMVKANTATFSLSDTKEQIHRSGHASEGGWKGNTKIRLVQDYDALQEVECEYCPMMRHN